MRNSSERGDHVTSISHCWDLEPLKKSTEGQGNLGMVETLLASREDSPVLHKHR